MDSTTQPEFDTLQWTYQQIVQGNGRPPFVLGTLAVLASTLCLAMTWRDIVWQFRAPRFPTINPQSVFTPGKAIATFLQNARELMKEGRAKFDGPFYLNTDNGPILIMPSEQTQAISREKKLGFTEFIGNSFFSHLETFKSFQNPHALTSSISKLTQRLPTFIKPVSAVSSAVLRELWGDGKEWHGVSPSADMTQLVAQVSSRVFVNEEISKNPEWIKLTIEHSAHLQKAAESLRLWPALLRPVVERFGPRYRAARAEHRRAVEILKPYIAARHAELKAAGIEERAPKLDDNIWEFARVTNKGDYYDEATLQLMVAFSATQTTADILTQALLFLAQSSKDVQALREEAISVLGKHGWHKHSMTEARLLDSFMKETQRLKPTFIASMQRIALDDVVLPDGLAIPKGTQLSIFGSEMWDASNYKNPEQFDGARFAKIRQQPGMENNAQFVATGQKHIGFGHGVHACPGRFFASNIIKICMMHIVMKYDVRIEDVESAKIVEFGNFMLANPAAKASVRRRESKMDVDALEL